jgi:cytochrome P450
VSGDPFRTYRERGPVHWHAPSRAWLVTGHAEVARLLLDPGLSSRTLGGHVGRLPGLTRADSSSLSRFFGGWLSLTDGEHHRELRRAIAPILAPGRVAPLLPHLHAAARRHADHADVDEPESTFARPYAASVTALALGLTDAETVRAIALTADLVRVLAPTGVGAREARAAASALAEVSALVAEVAARPPVRPEAPPLVTGCDLTPELRTAAFVQVIGGGYHPLARCLASVLAARAVGPDDEDLLEEAIRLHGPFELVPRIASEDVLAGGRRLHAGSRVMLAVGSANHDATAFTDPAALVPGRSVAHLAFGGGRHRCPAAGLARAALWAGIRSFPRGA